jgi:hypothetical protein
MSGKRKSNKRKRDDYIRYFRNWDLPEYDDLDEQNGNDINWKSLNREITIMTLLFLKKEKKRKKVMKN